MERGRRYRQPALPASPDLTERGVQEQLAGMGCSRYEIGVFDRQKDQMRLRSVDSDEVLFRLGRLKRENKHGADVYIRPAGSMGIVLVDDLSRGQLRQMEQDGATPSVVVRTSPPDNHQAWVRVHPEYLTPALATAVARELAVRYGGDKASATWNHLGRLAGYTNRKPSRLQPNGMYPFVRLILSQPHIAPAADELLAAGRAQLERKRALADATPPPPVCLGPGPAVDELIEQYRTELAAINQAHPEYTDQSRLDWTIMRTLAKRHPSASRDELIAVLVAASPRIQERKRSNVYAYAARTVEKIMGKRTIYERDNPTSEEGKSR